jgi:hypothetical protein
VENRFQSLPSKCNLQRYIEDSTARVLGGGVSLRYEVGLCTLNQVDP